MAVVNPTFINPPLDWKNLTLNQLVGAFQQIAYNHAQIQDFGEGEAYDISPRLNPTYPLLWITHLNSSFGLQDITHYFRVYVMDLVDPDLLNMLEVKSDVLTILWDVIFLLRDLYDLEVTTAATTNTIRSTAQDFEESFDDRVTGSYIDIGILTPMQYGYCDAPQKTNS